MKRKILFLLFCITSIVSFGQVREKEFRTERIKGDLHSGLYVLVQRSTNINYYAIAINSTNQFDDRYVLNLGTLDESIVNLETLIDRMNESNESFDYGEKITFEKIPVLGWTMKDDSHADVATSSPVELKRYLKALLKLKQ